MTECPDTAPTDTFDAQRTLSPQLEEQVDRFSDAMSGARSAAVAFSGGVDSSLVVALSVRLLMPLNVTAVLGVSASLAARERDGAHEVAAKMGVRVVEVATQEMTDPRYVVNDSQRCYFCKHELYTRSIAQVVADIRADVFLNGDTADDALRDDRPGQRAAVETGVQSPLGDAGLTKADVRGLARALGVPVWDKPSSPCLASRIPRAVPVTIDRLREVDRAEAALKDLGLHRLRVRHHGPVARVELGESECLSVQELPLKREVIEAVQRAGFSEVDLVAEPLVRE